VLFDGLKAATAISTTTNSPSSIRSEARRARAVLTTTAVELAKAQPPRDARHDNAELVAGLRFMGQEVARYARAAAARDWKALDRLGQQTARWPAFDDAMGALEDLGRKGYRVGDLSTTMGGGSLGNDCSGSTVTAPPVIGQPEPEAVRHLREAGLNVTVFPQIRPNPHVPEGVVVHESPQNFPLCKGAPVWIVVSIGAGA
jgi:hypothetical protein